MISVYQTIDGPDGNCFPACVASILEIKIEDVPEFQGWDGLRQWLRGRGWVLSFFQPDDPAADEWTIASLLTLRGFHAVVCFGGKIVHDPSPRQWSKLEHQVASRIQLRKAPCRKQLHTENEKLKQTK